MSGNSCASALQTAPIVTAFGRPCSAARAGSVSSSSGVSVSIDAIVRGRSAAQERELVLADLQLIAVREAMGLDPATVDVGAVQRAAVVEVVVAAPADDQRVGT